MQTMDFEEIAMRIISCAGSGKYHIGFAVEAFGKGDDSCFHEYLAKAEEDFAQAHKIQIGYLQTQVASKDANTPILLVHAMDILMNAMSELELVRSLLGALQKRYSEQKKD